MNETEYSQIARAMRWIDPAGDMDCFHQAWVESSRPDGNQFPVGAIVGRAKQRAIDERRRIKREADIAHDVKGRVGDGQPEGVVTEIAEAETHLRVRDAVSRLPPEYRAAISMRFLDETSPAEIASRMGCPRSSVYTRIRRGIELLRTDSSLIQLQF
jgi:RNA polymerase sigma factor (sigma-70 family)